MHSLVEMEKKECKWLEEREKIKQEETATMQQFQYLKPHPESSSVAFLAVKEQKGEREGKKQTLEV